MMRQPDAPDEVARRIVASTVQEGVRPRDLADAAEGAYHQLRERMVRLLGQSGFDALWARALRETERQVGLQARVVDMASPTDTRRALHALVDGHDAAEAHERLVAVFCTCIGLLYTFIGQDISFRLVQQIWPNVTFGDSQVGGEEATV